MNIEPDETFEMDAEAGSGSKSKLTINEESGSHKVPSDKNQRKVYGMILSNQSTTEKQAVTFYIEKDGTTERTLPPITVPYNNKNTKVVTPDMDNPLLTIRAGRNLKAQVTTGTGTVSVILQAYDI